MKIFKDKTGQEWTVEMNITAVKRVRDLLGINLCEPEGKEDGADSLIARIGTDEILLCDIIYCLIKPQADQRQITDEQFGGLLGGQAILSAQEAFYAEMVDFFQNRGRKDRAGMITKQREILGLAIQKAQVLIDGINANLRVEQTFSRLSTDLPAESGLTRET